MSSEVLEGIEKSWKELADLADGMDPSALAAAGPDAWAVKDHLVHVAAWEHSLLALLEGRDREAAMGIGHLDQETTDKVNNAVWNLHKDESIEEAMTYFRDAHARMMSVLGKLTADDMQRPYAYYQPSAADDPGNQQPVLGWVIGNTFHHYGEHIGWIKALPAAHK